MREIEAKILEVNRLKVENILEELGARKVFDGEMETFLYDFEDGRIIKSGDVLRLRREEEKYVLTYKSVEKDKLAKTAEEYSVVVSDLVVMHEILRRLNLVMIDRILKRRVSYELNGARIDIDRYLEKFDYVPEFLEIEAVSVDAIHECARILGFKAEDCLPWSTAQVMEHYSKKMK
jgi:predicted adenylyl cyclase CyaB